MASSDEDDLMDNVEDGGDDLFGDVDDAEEAPVDKTRELSDRELDSGDDEDHNDRAVEAEDEDVDGGSDARVVDGEVWKHNVPKPADGEINTLRLPAFLGLDPRPYDPKTFQPPTADHHSEVKSSNFSANAISASTMRYRFKESNQRLESNTVIYKWSDGSTTIGIGNQQYELQTKPLAPRHDSKPYQEVMDSHTYIASPSVSSQLLMIVGHMTNQYTVRPNKDIEDDALEKLQKSLAAATRGAHKGDNKNGPEMITTTEDPELQKKRAEMAEKERMRAQRRREAAAEKANQHRAAASGRGGLNVDELEGRSGRRAPGPSRKVPKPRKRRSDYDSDDDDVPRTRNKEDEYDMEDGFLENSDVEEATGDDDDEEEEEIFDDESDREQPKAKKQKLSKREEASDADADADAEADLDDEDPPTALAAEPSSRRKRNVIEDDDDE